MARTRVGSAAAAESTDKRQMAMTTALSNLTATADGSKRSNNKYNNLSETQKNNMDRIVKHRLPLTHTAPLTPPPSSIPI